ncbi:MAG: tautomerase family protein [Deltaproteobacteria bacterium]|nr:tautomerase family protein [Deltaproteobacteria bacterium]
MPLARIELIEGWSRAEKNLIMEAVDSAMVEALKIPNRNRVIRLFEHNREDFQTRPEGSDKCALVEITLFPGRSLEAKRKLYQLIVEKLEVLGAPRVEVKVVLYEPPMENWGIRGGFPASEVDLGFEVAV